MADALELNEVVVCSSKTTVVTYSETAAVDPNDALLQRSVSHVQSYNVLVI